MQDMTTQAISEGPFGRAANRLWDLCQSLRAAQTAEQEGDLALAMANGNVALLGLAKTLGEIRNKMVGIQVQMDSAPTTADVAAANRELAQLAAPKKGKYVKKSAYWKGKGKSYSRMPTVTNSQKGTKIPEARRRKIAAAAKKRKRDATGHFIPVKAKATKKKK